MISASILVVSYNHAAYISQCLRGILEQTTEKNIEIIWFDDASTDETVAIGEDVLKNCPWNVIRIHHPNNRYSRRVSPLLEMIEMCRGKYVFWVEGDDCWLDKDKIDLQIEALEQNPDIKICFTPAYIINSDDPNPIGITALYSEKQEIFSMEAVIVGDGGFMPTISLCINREVFNIAPNWLFEYLPVADYPIQVISSSPAGALYLPNITCAYRQQVEGSWTTRVFNNKKKRMIFEEEFISLLVRLHNYFPGYRAEFSKIIYNHYEALLGLSLEEGDFVCLQDASNALRDF